MGGPKGQTQTLQDPYSFYLSSFERIRGYVSSIPLTKRRLPASSAPCIALDSPPLPSLPYALLPPLTRVCPLTPTPIFCSRPTIVSEGGHVTPE